MADFVTMDDLKTRLGIPDAVDKFDGRLAGVAASVNALLLAHFCLDQVDPKAYDLATPLTGGPVPNVRTEVFPLVSVDAAALFGRDLTVADDVRIRSWSTIRFCGLARPPRARRLGVGCPTDCDDFTATVTAGFDGSVPMLANALTALRGGALDLAMQIYEARPGLKSEKVGKYAWTGLTAADRHGSGGLTPDNYPASLQMALAPFAEPFAMTTATRV